MGMKLHAGGSGLFRIEAQGCEGVEVRIAGDTEESVFEALEIPYKQPWERE
jgi:DNA polymerase/3'-5' exonuclease PolX